MPSFLTVFRLALGAVAGIASRLPPLERRYRLRNRLRGPWPKGPFLWLHGASMGECRMLLQLSERLQKDLPHCPPILLTTQKVEVLDFLKKEAFLAVANSEDSSTEDSSFPRSLSFALAPVDAPWAMRRFIRRVRPLALILGENELWPGYLSSMKKISAGPSVALVSGRFRRSLPGLNFSGIGYAAMQSSMDRNHLMAQVGNPRFAPKVVDVGGNWKLLSWAMEANDEKEPTPSGEVDVAFASAHLEEWSSISRMLRLFIRQGRSVIVAPRRLDEVRKFSERILDDGIHVVRWPEIRKGSVSMVTSFGVMDQVYAVSNMVVVGGSFSKKLGIHDFWEPLRKGCVTIVGPYAKGQENVVQSLSRSGVIAQIDAVSDLFRGPLPDKAAVRSYLSSEKEKISGSYQQLLNFIQRIL